MTQTKTCLLCNKDMKKEDYIIYSGFSNHFWERRKYCSKECERKANSKRNQKLKPWNLNNEHHQKIVKANNLIHGEITGINANKGEANGLTPDITTPDSVYEVEVFGHHLLKTKARYENYKDKKKVLIISLRENIKKLFDEIYILDDVKPLRESKASPEHPKPEYNSNRNQ